VRLSQPKRAAPLVGARNTTGELRFTWTIRWLVAMPPLACHRWRLAIAAYSTYSSKTDVGLMLSWRMPDNLPSPLTPIWVGRHRLVAASFYDP
jgi:hypothetical protein